MPKGVAARYGFGTPADIQAAADKSANDSLLRTLLQGRPRRPEDERHDWRHACRWRGGPACEVPAVAEVRPRRSAMGGRAMCTAHLHAMTAQGFRVSRWLTTRIRLQRPGLLVEPMTRAVVVALLEPDHALAPDQAAKVREVTAEMQAVLDRHSCGFTVPRPTLSPKDIAAAVRRLGE